MIEAALFAATDPTVGTNLFLDPTTGELMVNEGFAVVFGLVLWIFGVVAGLATSWLVLP